MHSPKPLASLSREIKIDSDVSLVPKVHNIETKIKNTHDQSALTTQITVFRILERSTMDTSLTTFRLIFRILELESIVHSNKQK